MTITVDGTTYNVPIESLEDSLEFLDKYAERTEDGILHRELIGTFPKQSLVFGTPQTAAERAEYASLWSKLAEAVEFHTVTVPDEDSVDFTFEAYVSNLSRKLKKWNGSKTQWGGYTVNFTAQAPRSTP